MPVNNWTLPFLIPLLIPNNGPDTSGLQTAFSASQEITTFQEEYFRKKLQWSYYGRVCCWLELTLHFSPLHSVNITNRIRWRNYLNLHLKKKKICIASMRTYFQMFYFIQAMMMMDFQGRLLYFCFLFCFLSQIS